jgi:hypothetical protein
VAVTDDTDTELSKLFIETGMDLATLPAIATPDDLAPVVKKSPAALAQDRYHRRGIPYVKYGRSVRYLRADVARYLLANRSGVA